MMSEEKHWYDKDPLLREYHDHEWGVPHHDDQALFELLALEMLQAGLNWQMVLRKRAAFRAAFHQFDIDQVAAMQEPDIDALMQRPELIRNRRKLEAIVTNAQAVQHIQQEFGSFDAYLWAFVDGKPIVNRPQREADVASSTPLSAKAAKDMKQRGFKFVGPVIVYSYFEGAGLIDDHLADWHRPAKEKRG